MPGPPESALLRPEDRELIQAVVLDVLEDYYPGGRRALFRRETWAWASGLRIEGSPTGQLNVDLNELEARVRRGEGADYLTRWLEALIEIANDRAHQNTQALRDFARLLPERVAPFPAASKRTSASSAPLEARCGRKEHVGAIKGRPPIARGAVVRGAVGAGHAWFATRCAAWPGDLGVEHTVVVKFPPGEPLTSKGDGWDRLACALDNERLPGQSPRPVEDAMAELEELAKGGRVAIVHDAVRIGEGELPSLELYHADLDDELRARNLSNQVFVVQLVEELPTGFSVAVQRWLRISAPPLSRAVWATGPHALSVAPLGSLEAAEIDEFATSLVEAGLLAEPHKRAFVEDVANSGPTADERFARMRVRIRDAQPGARP